MNKTWNRHLEKGFAFLELLLVLLIIPFIFFKVINFYFKRSPVNKEDEKSLSEQGIDTRNYKTVLDSSREKIQDINEQAINRAKELEAESRR